MAAEITEAKLAEWERLARGSYGWPGCVLLLTTAYRGLRVRSLNLNEQRRLRRVIDALNGRNAELREALGWTLAELATLAHAHRTPDDPMWADISRALKLLRGKPYDITD